MSQMNRRRALQLLAALGATGLARRLRLGRRRRSRASDGPGQDRPRRAADRRVQGHRRRDRQRLPALPRAATSGGSAAPGRAAHGRRGRDRQDRQGGRRRSCSSRACSPLTGVVNSAVMLGIRDSVEQAQVPLIGSNASPTSLQSDVYIWRTSYVLDEAGQALGPLRDRPQVGPGRDRRAGLPRPARTAARASGRTSAADDRLIDEPASGPDAANPARTLSERGHHRATNRGRRDVLLLHRDGGGRVRPSSRGGLRGQLYAAGFLTEGRVLTELRQRRETPGASTPP